MTDPTLPPEGIASGWQAIESAPKDGTPVRLKWEGTTVEAIGRWVFGNNLRYASSRWRDVLGDDELLEPTHWQPRMHLHAPPGATIEPVQVGTQLVEDVYGATHEHLRLPADVDAGVDGGRTNSWPARRQEIAILEKVKAYWDAQFVGDYCPVCGAPESESEHHADCLYAEVCAAIKVAPPGAEEPAPPCNLCGGPYSFDTSLPSVVWNAVIRATDLPDYLCLTCIVRAFVRQNRSFTATLWGDGFNGTSIEVQINNATARDAALVSEENTELRGIIAGLRDVVAGRVSSLESIRRGLSAEDPVSPSPVGGEKSKS